MLTLSQGTLLITKHCQLRCLGCQLWQAMALHPDRQDRIQRTLTDLLETGTFFNYYPQKKLYHIMGGDPLLHKDWGKLIDLLHHKGIKTAVWTHAHQPMDALSKLANKTDYICLYLCATEPDAYRNITGINGLDEFNRTLRYLSSIHPRVIIHFPILPGRLEFLPDVKLLAQTTQTKLFLHYDPTSFNREQRAYITRFKWIDNIYLFKTRYDQGICHALPYSGLMHPGQILGNMFISFLKQLRSFIN